MQSVIERSLEQAEILLRVFRSDPKVLETMSQIVDAITECFKTDHNVLACGNGGSMADAMHFAEEFSGRFRLDRRPYGAIALSDPAHMSCVANDFGFDHVFSRQVEGLGKAEDLLVLLTTSGNSKNLVLAAQAAKSRKMKVIGLVGRGGGALASECDIVLEAPGEGSDRIQEIHMVALHIIIEAVELKLGHGSLTQ